MYYCNVINGEILTTPRQLPEDIDPQLAMESGWHPVVFLNMPHHIEPECNKVTQIIQMNCALVENQVQCVHVVQDKFPDAIEATNQLLRTAMRQERNRLLLLTDWTQLPTNTLNPQQKAEWEVYRNLLRNLPQVALDLNNIPWPTPPFNIDR